MRNNHVSLIKGHFVTALLLAGTGTASAANVTFAGAVANICVLTVTTPGTLVAAASGTTLSSDAAGGVPATLTVAATGTNPTVTFTAPQLTGPATSTGGAISAIEYSSPGGANQALTSSATSYAMSRLIDTLTIKGQATNPNGFVTGTYMLGSIATCQQ